MITEILPDFYQLQVPFPKNPLKNCNCYLIKDNGRALMVDTAVNLEETRDALFSELSEIKVDLTKTDFFLTHMHTDHTGLLARLVRDPSTVYFSKVDAGSLNYNIEAAWERRVGMATRNGFPRDVLLATGNAPMYQFREWTDHELHLIKQDDTISIGDYRFSCLETPGHTRGHVCLYEPDKKIIISGDHVLGDISPNISTWSADENPLADYLASLDKVYKLDVHLVLPGHRRPFNNLKERVSELKRHHEVRANEAFEIVKREKLNAYQVSSRMTWDLKYTTWDTVPVWQRMFALGEALAHLKYLQSVGKVQEERTEKEILYSAV